MIDRAVALSDYVAGSLASAVFSILDQKWLFPLDAQSQINGKIGSRWKKGSIIIFSFVAIFCM